MTTERGSIWTGARMTCLNWEALKKGGLPLIARTKFNPNSSGSYEVEGWDLFLFSGRAGSGGRKHRLFVDCECGLGFFEAGHYGMHYHSKRHEKAMAKGGKWNDTTGNSTGLPS